MALVDFDGGGAFGVPDAAAGRSGAVANHLRGMLETGGEAMKARPILFSAPMVQALLAGKKTQTRRLLKNPDDGVSTSIAVAEYNRNAEVFCCDENGNWQTRTCPHGRVGDFLWARETFCQVDDDGVFWVDYRATPRYSAEKPAGWHEAPNDPEALNWKPSIFMPRAASRIVLEIVQVRAQRLHSIDHIDALAEGVQGVEEYQALWESLNGKESWAANPWVWVLDFTVHLQNVDDFLQMRGAA